MRFKLMGTLALLLVLFAGIGSAEAPVSAQQSSQQSQYQQSQFAREVRAAANEFGVPAELLLAMGYVNTRWEMRGDASRDGGWGVMHLVQNSTDDSLGEAARLAGVSEAQIKQNRYQNLRGGAALLANAQDGGSDDLNGWYDAVAEAGGGSLYANQVYDTLGSGASAVISTGEQITLPAQSGAALREGMSAQSAADYPAAIWYPAYYENYTVANRPKSNKIDKIVIHVTQGSYAASMNWFQNPSSEVSAHYTVRSSDGVIGQSVHQKDIAYHAGNYQYNTNSVGIEHEGYVDDPKWFTDAMYRSSAKLAAYQANKYNIPIDRQHIIGHSEVPGADHTDPGPYWDWELYLTYVRQYAAAAGGGSAFNQVVDNADATTSGRFAASGAWRWSSWNSGRHYWNYRFTTPKASSDTAIYEFDIPSRGSYAVYGWWPSDPGYNSRAPVGIKTASGWRWLTVNQAQNGGTWVHLGTYDMAAGDGPYVQVSRWTSGKGLIVADAFKIVRK